MSRPQTLQVPSGSRSTSGSNANTTTTVNSKQVRASKKGGFELWGSTPSSDTSSVVSPDSRSIKPSRQGSFALADGNSVSPNEAQKGDNATSRLLSRKGSVATSALSPLATGSASFTSVTSGHERSPGFQPGQLQAKLATLEAPPEEVTDKDSEVDSRDLSKGDGVTVG